jgi:SAM-dependent methyltransferase
LKRSDILNSLHVSKNDIVLEIGPGNMPFNRSNIHLERDLTNNIERAGDFQLTKPCVLGDAHSLPFEDKSIDYIFCAQVLEHADNPDKMLKEMMRVGKKGFIETTNFYREVLFGWPFHKWVVEKENNKLFLYENKLPQYFGDFFHRLQAEEYSFQLFYNLSFEKFNTIYEWESSVDYEIKNFEDLIAKYKREGNDKLYIKHDTKKNDVNYDGVLSLKLFAECIPSFRRQINMLLKYKNLFNRNKQKTDINTNVKTVIKKMKCMSCGGKFNDYAGEEHIQCKSCANYLTVKNDILIIDNEYEGAISCK